MGSPLSPVTADLLMEMFEPVALDRGPFKTMSFQICGRHICGLVTWAETLNFHLP